MREPRTSESAIDLPRPVREGEELDVARLAAYLEDRSIGNAGVLHVEQFPRGFSNLTYLVRLGDREMVLRRPPFGVRPGSAHDMSREYRILSAIRGHYARVPRALLYCDDESVIGAPFYLMERVRGVILRDRVPDGVPRDADAMRALSMGFIDNLVEIHRVDLDAAGLRDLGNPQGYVERQVAGWTNRYVAARTGEQREVESAAAWLAAHRPRDGPGALIHNDYKYDNLVLDPAALQRIVAVLDWEMATIGDPLMDLGTSLAYWVEAGDPAEMHGLGLGVTALPGNLTRRELVDRYVEKARREVTDAVFYYVFGLFKVAVIAQQIYARFVRGYTRDARFAALDQVVRSLGIAAVRAAASGQLD